MNFNLTIINFVPATKIYGFSISFSVLHGLTMRTMALFNSFPEDHETSSPLNSRTNLVPLAQWLGAMLMIKEVVEVQEEPFLLQDFLTSCFMLLDAQ